MLSKGSKTQIHRVKAHGQIINRQSRTLLFRDACRGGPTIKKSKEVIMVKVKIVVNFREKEGLGSEES